MNNGELMDVVSHCLDDDVHKINCLDSVYRRDNFTSYIMGQQSNNNPIRSYRDGTYESPARGDGYYNLVAMDNTVIPANTTQDRVVVFEATEAILCPPFFFEKREEQPALFGVKTLDVSINWNGNLGSCLWSRIEAVGGVSATITDVSITQPYMYLETFTPQTGYVIPKQIAYDVFDMKAYTQGGQSVVAGATSTLYNNNILLGNSCPTRLFVFARRNSRNLTPLQANTFLRITGVSCQFNNTTGLLSGASPQQLWDMSRKNGLEQEYEEWFGRRIGATRCLSGGMILIDPSKDMGLDTTTNGVSGNNQLSLEL